MFKLLACFDKTPKKKTALLPALQLVQAGEQWTTDGGDLLPSLPVLQLGVELGGHQVVDLFDHNVHLGQDLLTEVRKKNSRCG